MNKVILQDCERMHKETIIDWDKVKNSTFLITGAYGMLASYMVWFLIYLNEYKGYNIRILALCRNTKKAYDKFGEYCDREYFNLIIKDVSAHLDIEGPIDYIIHAASFASSQYYSTNPVDVITPNVLGTYYTLELAKNKGSKGYLFFSSGEVYGKLDVSVMKESDSGYLDCTDVRSCYGESKRLGENLVKAYYHQYGVPTNSVRPSHTYGPTMDLENDQRVFSEFIKNILNNEDICMKSDGLAERSFCYIYDATLAYFKILLEGERGESYNVANAQAQISIRNLAFLLVGLFPEKKLSVSYEKREGDYLENSNKVHPKFSTEKLESLGWNARFSIAEGFERTVLSFCDDEKNCTLVHHMKIDS